MTVWFFEKKQHDFHFILILNFECDIKFFGKFDLMLGLVYTKNSPNFKFKFKIIPASK